jgi:glutathione synthase/RimK-type ligase-like ATP-grasp enzyme
MRSKALQLELARRIGFAIPDTLITNDPAEARAFLTRPGEFVVKGISPMYWDEPGQVIALPTSKVALADLDEEISVQACPMIYQRLVAKAYEFRVMVFGARSLWIKLHSQDEGRYKTDWRHGMATEMRLEAVPPPPSLEGRILAFCREAGLLHASFDLAVTPDGEIVFFEVNEQGQTLWVEEVNPEIPVLSCLARFLFDPAEDVARPWGSEPIRLADYMPAAA